MIYQSNGIYNIFDQKLKVDQLLVNIPGNGNLGYGKNFLATAFGGSSSGDGHLKPTTVSLLPLQS